MWAVVKSGVCRLRRPCCVRGRAEIGVSNTYCPITQNHSRRSHGLLTNKCAHLGVDKNVVGGSDHCDCSLGDYSTDLGGEYERVKRSGPYTRAQAKQLSVVGPACRPQLVATSPGSIVEAPIETTTEGVLSDSTVIVTRCPASAVVSGPSSWSK